MPKPFLDPSNLKYVQNVLSIQHSRLTNYLGYDELNVVVSRVIFLFVYYCQITSDNVKHDARKLNHNERNPDTLSEPP